MVIRVTAETRKILLLAALLYLAPSIATAHLKNLQSFNIVLLKYLTDNCNEAKKNAFSSAAQVIKVQLKNNFVRKARTQNY